MAVASYHQGPYRVGPRQIYAPKASSIPGWWNAVRKAFPDQDFGTWKDVRPNADFDEATIHFYGKGWDVFVSRKRNLQ